MTIRPVVSARATHSIAQTCAAMTTPPGAAVRNISLSWAAPASTSRSRRRWRSLFRTFSAGNPVAGVRFGTKSSWMVIVRYGRFRP
jgi:hypothetical protein